ncbi:unnamed protein product [Ectocarpus sp. 8 AP-2014]
MALSKSHPPLPKTCSWPLTTEGVMNSSRLVPVHVKTVAWSSIPHKGLSPTRTTIKPTVHSCQLGALVLRCICGLYTQRMDQHAHHTNLHGKRRERRNSRTYCTILRRTVDLLLYST